MIDFLELQGVSKYFGFTRALYKVSFQVKQGEMLVLLGPNGAGKSTLLMCIAGILRPDEGTIVFCTEVRNQSEKKDISADFKKGRNSKDSEIKIGFVSQQSFLYGDLTIEENLHLHSCLIWQSASMDPRLEKIKKIIKDLGLTNTLRKKLRECSEGIRRRASIARAVLAEPDFLVLDEPFSNLDLNGQEQLSILLRNHHQQGKTAILTTHEPQVVKAHATRVLTMQKGSICDYEH